MLHKPHNSHCPIHVNVYLTNTRYSKLCLLTEYHFGLVCESMSRLNVGANPENQRETIPMAQLNPRQMEVKSQGASSFSHLVQTKNYFTKSNWSNLHHEPAADSLQNTGTGHLFFCYAFHCGCSLFGRLDLRIGDCERSRMVLHELSRQIERSRPGGKQRARKLNSWEVLHLTVTILWRGRPWCEGTGRASLWLQGWFLLEPMHLLKHLETPGPFHCWPKHACSLLSKYYSRVPQNIIDERSFTPHSISLALFACRFTYCV